MLAGSPLDAAGMAALLGDVRDHVLTIHDLEEGAVAALCDAMN